jgi:hypothetical protein
MKTIRMLPLIVVVLTAVVLMGCGMLGSLLNAGSGAGNVAQLWTDVPALDGTTKTNLDMPLAFRLMIQAAFKGGIEYIAYTTKQTPDAVQSFYSVERMQSNGWKAADMSGNQADQQSCFGDTSGSSSSSSGALCLFTKQEGTKKYILAIVVAADDKTKETNVFYARIDASKLDETPAASQSPAAAVPPAATLAASSNAAASLDRTDVCSLLPKETVEAVLGRNLIGAPTPSQGEDLGNVCSYSAGKDSANNAYFAYVSLAPEANYARMKQGGFSVKPVSGIGDDAFTTNGPDALQLWVQIKGKGVVVAAIGDQPNLEGAKQLATYLIGRL